MTMRRRQHGFTLIELMIVVAIIGILASIAIPSFLRFQARARQAEVSTQLKSFFTSLRTMQRKPAIDIHATGVSPERGNRYSYHIEDGCSSYEDRSSSPAKLNNGDTCVGADKARYVSFPNVFVPVPPESVTWETQAMTRGLSNTSGFFGADERWEFLVYAAGDVDDNPEDTADTWLVASSDGTITPTCPFTGGLMEPISAGEPYNTNNDVSCP
jgi:type IV pilus assembly protein PilA